MKISSLRLGIVTCSALIASGLAAAAQPPGPPAQGGPPQTPPQPMSFFVTSTGKGDGANLGGLAGADAHCQTLAAAVGRGDAIWHAYLSTQGPNAVDARDRIGKGPWYNARGVPVAQDLAELHGDTLDLARRGNHLFKTTVLTERGSIIAGIGDSTPNQHDILTGTTLEGRAYTDNMDHTCNNWTSNDAGSAQVGHSDRVSIPTTNGSWVSSHPSRGCSQANLVGTGGAGLLYCFAVTN